MVLALLGKGHTVKSAANITGDSENAVNELLRSARRKLGVASSREAARIYAQAQSPTQEFRDDKIGIEETHPPIFKSSHLAIGGVMLATVLAISAVLFLSAAGTSEARHQDIAAEQKAVEAEIPKVVESFPENGAKIGPGPFELRVTYDRPMAANSMSFATGPEPAFPKCDGTPIQSDDLRSYSMQCEAIAGAEYTVWFNYGAFMSFRSAENGRAARPHRITFSARE